MKDSFESFWSNKENCKKSDSMSTEQASISCNRHKNSNQPLTPSITKALFRQHNPKRSWSASFGVVGLLLLVALLVRSCVVASGTTSTEDELMSTLPTTTTMIVDVAIIGAGPGGLSCALALDRRHQFVDSSNNNNIDPLSTSNDSSATATTSSSTFSCEASSPPSSSSSSTESSSSSSEWKIVVFERAKELRSVGAALGLNTIGYDALQTISPKLHDTIRSKSANPHKHILQTPQGEILYNDESVFRNTDMTWLSWYTLQSSLRHELQQQQQQQPGPTTEEAAAEDGTMVKPRVPIYVNHKLVSLTDLPDQGYVELLFEHSSDAIVTTTTVLARLVIGADGVQSMVRKHTLDDGLPNYTGTMTWRGIVDRKLMRQVLVERGLAELYGLSNDDNKDSDDEEENINISIIGDGKNLWIMDCGDGMVAWTGTALQDSNAKTPNATETALQVFDNWPPIVSAMIEMTDPLTVVESGVYDRDPVTSWSNRDISTRTTLVGDAAHPMRPSLGLGSTMAFQDAIKLAKVLKSINDLSNGTALSQALSEYETERIQVTTPLVYVARKQGEASHNPDQAQKFLRMLQAGLEAKQLKELAQQHQVSQPSVDEDHEGKVTTTKVVVEIAES